MTLEEACAEAAARLTLDLRTTWPDLTAVVRLEEDAVWVTASGTGEWSAAVSSWEPEDEDNLSEADLEEFVELAAWQLCMNAWPDEWTDRWPLCPEHRDHSLEPSKRAAEAVWACPIAATPYYAIGDLPRS